MNNKFNKNDFLEEYYTQCSKKRRKRISQWFVLLPPVYVFLKEGFRFHLILNCALTLWGYIPGLAHAIWIESGKKFSGSNDDLIDVFFDD